VFPGRGTGRFAKSCCCRPALRVQNIGSSPTLMKCPQLGSAYHGTLVHMPGQSSTLEVERMQTGVRIEKRLLKVLKALAELKDMSLGDLLEGIVLHAFEGKPPFSPQTLKEIKQLKAIYGLTLQASDSHNLKERQ
jgi:hypothetical protein